MMHELTLKQLVRLVLGLALLWGGLLALPFTERKLSLFSKLAVRKQKRRDYVQPLIDPGHADNWPSAPIGTLDHIIILST
jgi:hypothetical protein